MTPLERFRRTVRFQPVDHAPYHVTPGWGQTIRRWRREGLPEDTSLEDYFGSEPTMDTGVYFGPWPRFEREILEDEGETRIVRNHEAIVMREYVTDTERSMPHFLEFPVKTREDYRRLLKPRLTGPPEDRLPADWSARVARFANRHVPLSMFADRWGGFFGPLRNMMGLEGLVYAFFDDPQLVEEMMDDIAANIISIAGMVLDQTDIEFFGFWEDMGMKTGPLLSPPMFEQYMVPRYRRVTDFLRSRGVEIIGVDSDGDCRRLIPGWLRGGLNALWPLEIAAGMEPLPIRQEYGDALVLFGGIDKRALAAGTEAIDRELQKVPPLVTAGGYVPTIDHGVPPDVPWEAYCYYMRALKRLL